jgi:hypothetical protein
VLQRTHQATADPPPLERHLAAAPPPRGPPSPMAVMQHNLEAVT